MLKIIFKILYDSRLDIIKLQVSRLVIISAYQLYSCISFVVGKTGRKNKSISPTLLSREFIEELGNILQVLEVAT